MCGKVTFVHQEATITPFIILLYYFFQYADMLILHDFFLFKGDTKTILHDLYLKRCEMIYPYNCGYICGNITFSEIS